MAGGRGKSLAASAPLWHPAPVRPREARKMPHFLFPPEPSATLPIAGSDRLYPVRRIFCVGRNYAAHAAEMGNEVDREAPFYFTKTPFALAPSGSVLPYPPGTSDLHHEVELVVAIGAPAFRVTVADAPGAVWGFGAGLDMTRRDLQALAKDQRRPWDIGKDFEGSAVIGALTEQAKAGIAAETAIALSVGGLIRQSARLGDMVWSVAEIIAHLSTLYHLGRGDLIMTGTPAGVGAVVAGDRLEGRIAGLEPVRLAIGPPA